jgi:hypothetical protein
MPMWRPVPTFRSTLLIFLVFGTIFLSLGILLYVMSEKVQEVSVRYDKSCTTLNKECTLQLTVDKDMNAPIYVYYELDNFY